MYVCMYVHIILQTMICFASEIKTRFIYIYIYIYIYYTYIHIPPLHHPLLHKKYGLYIYTHTYIRTHARTHAHKYICIRNLPSRIPPSCVGGKTSFIPLYEHYCSCLVCMFSMHVWYACLVCVFSMHVPSSHHIQCMHV